jgi:hypothetical protein
MDQGQARPEDVVESLGNDTKAVGARCRMVLWVGGCSGQTVFSSIAGILF